jgi:hypothetical protein
MILGATALILHPAVFAIMAAYFAIQRLRGTWVERIDPIRISVSSIFEMIENIESHIWSLPLDTPNLSENQR